MVVFSPLWMILITFVLILINILFPEKRWNSDGCPTLKLVTLCWDLGCLLSSFFMALEVILTYLCFRMWSPDICTFVFSWLVFWTIFYCYILLNELAMSTRVCFLELLFLLWFCSFRVKGTANSIGNITFHAIDWNICYVTEASGWLLHLGFPVRFKGIG